MIYLKRVKIITLIVLCLIWANTFQTSQAYTTTRVWPYDVGAGVTYTIDPNLNSALGVSNATNAINAAGATWDGSNY